MFASRRMVQLALRWRVCRVSRYEQATKRRPPGNAPPLLDILQRPYRPVRVI